MSKWDDLIEPSEFFSVKLRFRSGTPDMELWCSHLGLSDGVATFDARVDGKVGRITEVKVDRLASLAISFDPPTDESGDLFRNPRLRD